MSGSADFPDYSYADEMLSPRELNIKRDGSFDGIMRAVAGVNYYADSIGFGESTGFAKMNNMYQVPLGLRFFVNTGQVCSNGAKMYEYVDTVPKGIGGRVGQELNAMGLPNLRGMGPGIVEDAVKSLNPGPMLDAMVRGGYPKCKQVTLPVGDMWGGTASRFNPSKPWIEGPTKPVNGKPHQTRWIFDKWIGVDEYDATPKTAKEGFCCGSGSDSNSDSSSTNTTFSLKSSQVAAVALTGLLVTALYLTTSKKK